MSSVPVPSDQERFRLELEFVSCLGNPDYVQWLGIAGYLSNPVFVEFLSYLQYWHRPEYAVYVRWPHCLYFLGLLQDKEFRGNVATDNATKILNDAQEAHFLGLGKADGGGASLS